MKWQDTRKSKSFSTLNRTSSATPQQFRQLGKTQVSSGKPANLRSSIKDRVNMKDRISLKDRSFSDSDSSDSNCFDKKFYRCGCLSGCHHHHHYRDYLAEFRKVRMQRKEKAALNPYDLQLDKLGLDSLSLSETEKSEAEMEPDVEVEADVCTPKKAPLDRIMEINESAEYSKRKNLNSISISLYGKKYYKTFTSKEEVLECFRLLEQMLQK